MLPNQRVSVITCQYSKGNKESPDIPVYLINHNSKKEYILQPARSLAPPGDIPGFVHFIASIGLTAFFTFVILEAQIPLSALAFFGTLPLYFTLLFIRRLKREKLFARVYEEKLKNLIEISYSQEKIVTDSGYIKQSA